MSAERITIASMGAEGDGFAMTASGPVFVPFTLPGETVTIARDKGRGHLVALIEGSPERVEPACPHFGPGSPDGACGSCALQHWSDAPYQAWKAGLVAEALAARKIDTRIEALIPAAAGDRRRVTLSGRTTDKGLVLGFQMAESHQIVPVSRCIVASAAINARLPEIRRIAATLAGGSDGLRLTVLDTLSGLDLAFEKVKKPDDKRRRAVIETVLQCKGISRVSLDGEILVEPERPELDFSGTRVSPPPGAFTQASARAEQAMAAIVLGHLGKARKVADLFSGCGTFALRIARQSAVHAVEFDGPALAALDQAARRTQGLKPVTVERRDLFRRPMQPMDLKGFDAVVFDPPRAGAEAQAKELARTKTISRIAAVSCNPVTLARDLDILVGGGYRVIAVTPIDQFLHSAHVEAVALLERPKP